MSELPHLLLVIRKLNKTHEMNLQSECLARGNLETNPITIKPEIAGYVAKSPRLPYPAAVLPALPNQVSFFVSTCELTLGPWKGFPFMQ